MTEFHSTAPFQIEIDGYAVARCYWHYFDMLEAADELEKFGKLSFRTFERGSNGELYATGEYKPTA